MKAVIYFLFLMSMLVVSGCSNGPKRLDPNDREIHEERVNADDMRDAGDSLSRKMLAHRWLNEWSLSHPDRSPIVCVLEVENETDQYELKTRFLTQGFEIELGNSGRVVVMTERKLREYLRVERTDQEFTADEYRQKVQNTEFMPDFLLYGAVTSDREMSRSRSQTSYTAQLSMDLMDVRTGAKPWQGREIVKKGVR